MRDVESHALEAKQGSDDTADDLGNMMFKNDTGHLLYTRSTLCICLKIPKGE